MFTNPSKGLGRHVPQESAHWASFRSLGNYLEKGCLGLHQVLSHQHGAPLPQHGGEKKQTREKEDHRRSTRRRNPATQMASWARYPSRRLLGSSRHTTKPWVALRNPARARPTTPILRTRHRPPAHLPRGGGGWRQEEGPQSWGLRLRKGRICPQAPPITASHRPGDFPPMICKSLPRLTLFATINGYLRCGFPPQQMNCKIRETEGRP